MLKGSTIIETIVAMVIILTCSSLALSHFSGLFRDTNEELRIEAELKIHDLSIRTIAESDFSNLTIDTAGIRILRSIDDYQFQPTLKILRIEAYTLSGKKICEMKKLIYPF